MSRLLATIVSSILLILVYGFNYTLGQSLGDLSVIFPFDIMPPGISFGVARSLIYTALLGMMIYLWFADYKWNSTHKRFHIMFWISCVLNIARITSTWYQAYAVSVAIIIMIAVVLRMLLATVRDNLESRGSGFFRVAMPVALYLSWIMTASSAIATSQAVFLIDSSFATGLVWQLVALSLGLIVGLVARYRFHYDVVLYLLLWALGGIAVKNMTENPSIAILSIFGIVVFATLISRYVVYSQKK